MTFEEIKSLSKYEIFKLSEEIKFILTHDFFLNELENRVRVSHNSEDCNKIVELIRQKTCDFLGIQLSKEQYISFLAKVVTATAGVHIRSETTNL